MAEWSKNRVDPSEINGGSEFTTDNNFTLKELNTIVNNSFYASDKADEAKSIVDTANTKATNAETTANTASANSSIALSTANTALTNSTTAISTANDAHTQSLSAIDTSEESLDIVEHLVVDIDNTSANNVGIASLTFTSYTENGKQYKKLKASNLKGEKGEKGDAGNSVTIDDTLSSTSTNPVQNKVLYNPVSFAENERQKSSNLLPLITSGTYPHASNFLTISGDSFHFSSVSSTNASAVLYHQVYNKIYLKSGTQYTLKIYDLSGTTANILVTMGVKKLDGTYMGDYAYFYFPTTYVTFTPTEEVYIDWVGIYTTEGRTFDFSGKIGLYEGTAPSTFTHPYGDIVHANALSRVEHIEVLYDKSDTNESLNWAHTSGILDENIITGISFAKYNKLFCYFTSDANGNYPNRQMQAVCVVDMTNTPNGIYRGACTYETGFTGLGEASTDVIQIINCYITVGANKDYLKVQLKNHAENDAIWTSSACFVYKIEGAC